MELTQEQKRLERKIQYFEYIVSKLIEWYEDVKEENDESFEKHFSRIVVMKLLFFVAAVKNEKGEDLLDIFNDFYAMQYGPVEGEIYTAMEEERLVYYSFPVFPIPELEIKEKPEMGSQEQVDEAIKALRGKNPKLVRYTSSKLIVLSHRWLSWRVAISIARLNGLNCESMTTQDIREDEMFFE